VRYALILGSDLDVVCADDGLYERDDNLETRTTLVCTCGLDLSSAFSFNTGEFPEFFVNTASLYDRATAETLEVLRPR
jgi:hypothetical protein